MKQNTLKRILAGCLLLAILLSGTEWSYFSSVIHAEAAIHTHTDACYVTEYCGTYRFKEYECSRCSATGDYGDPHYDTCSSCNGTGGERCNGSVTMGGGGGGHYCWYNSADDKGPFLSFTSKIPWCSKCTPYSSATSYYSPSECPHCGEIIGPSIDDMDFTHSFIDCTSCGGTGGSQCGYFTDDRYECSGCYDEITNDGGTHYKRGALVCDQVVTALVPKEPVQTPIAGNPINTKATATFLDGHTAEVTCTVTNYNDALYNTAQTVTFSYGTYKTNANTAGPYSVTVSITVQGEFQLTVTSEDVNKGTVSNSSGKVLCNKEVSIQAMAKTGYTFAGWYSGSTVISTANPYTFNMPAADTTYVAKFTANFYTLTVVTENSYFGSVTGGGSVQYGTSTTIKATPSTGYKFVGWYDGTTSVSTNATYTFTMPHKEYILMAKFVPVTMTVTFNANGGSVGTSTKNVTYGDIYGEMPIPTKDGYTFMGWYLNGSPVTSGTVVKQTANHTLTASWGDIGVASMTVIYDKLYASLPNPTRPGYTFNGWFFNEINNNGSGIAEDRIKNGDVVKLTKETTVYANWTPNQYTITFDGNGGVVNPTTKTVTYDKYYGTLPVPTKNGYTFTGWYPAEVGDNGTGTPIKPMDIVNILTAQTLYAGYTKDPVNVTVSFNANGGTVSTPSKVVTYPGTYGTLPTPTRPGHTFNGWYTAESGGTNITASSSVIGGYPHTLYAQWMVTATYSLTANGSLDGGTATTNLATYVTFDVSIDGRLVADDVSSYSSGGYVYGTKYTISDVNEKIGYSFTGFTTTGSGELTANTTVSLKISSNSYSITLDPNGGTNNTAYTGPLTVTYNKTTNNDISKYVPTKAGYSFTGWLPSAVGGMAVYLSDGKYNYTSSSPYWTSSGAWKYANSITVYAAWSPNNYTVTFDANGGTVDEKSRVVQYNALYERDIENNTTRDFPTPSRTGYIFAGWYTAESGGILVESKDKVVTAKNHTLYAHWEENVYTIAFDQQGATTIGTMSVKALYDKAMPTPITLPVKEYTIAFNGAGGTSDKSTLKATHTFNGYYTKGYGEGVQYYTSTGASARNWDMTTDTTLYASWTEKSITLPSAAKTGYTFLGWYTEENNGEFVGNAGETYTPTSSETLYAHWGVNTYKVTLSQPSATVQGTTSVNVPFDSEMPIISIPKRNYKVTFNTNEGSCSTAFLISSYIFGGYYTGTDGTGAQYYNGDGTSARVWDIAQDTTLHEKWRSVAITLPTPTRTGYTFLGWYTDITGGTKIGDAGVLYKPTKDIVLYAQWKANDYTVTFDWNFNWDAPGIETNTNWSGNTKTVTFDSVYGTLPLPSREGYEFMGWFTGESEDGNGEGTQIDSSTIVSTASNHTLYAKWSVSYMQTADVWLKTLRKQEAAVTNGDINELQMLEFGDTLLNTTVTTDGFFDYFKVNLPWTTPIIVDFDDGIYDKANDLWYLPSEDYIQIFAPGADPTVVRNNPGYTNESHLIAIDFYKKDGTILDSYKVKVVFIPYNVWKEDVIIGRKK